MPTQATHREIKNPQISGRYLADYMAASETAKRSIVRNAKYHAAVRVIQHDEAKVIVAKFLLSGNTNIESLLEQAALLKLRIADSQFDRDLYDHNSDYVARFAKMFGELVLPDAQVSPVGDHPAIVLNGTKVTADLQ